MPLENPIESHISLEDFRNLRLEDKVDAFMQEFVKHRTFVEAHITSYEERDKKELDELVRLKEKGKGIFLILSLGAGTLWTALQTDITKLFK